ncbi:MAG: riboflavin synthase [Candidatus Marinimicrobia bacterium]|nr:riboflavin synthase [Candidatus Neomarinimicrobiota bacterium]
MFTGLIEEQGTVQTFQRKGDRYDLTVTADKILADVKIDDSINVNGVCLTVVDHSPTDFSVQIVPQTVKKSALKYLKPGDAVNLERAMAAGGRFGGHFVQGHADGTAQVRALYEKEDWAVLTLEVPDDLVAFCVSQGSITIEGVSLTIAEIRERELDIAIIPHTLKVTTLGHKRQGDEVNIEVDLLSKYVHKHLNSHQKTSKLSLEWLEQQGY